MGRRICLKAMSVVRVMTESTIITRVPREIFVYLWIIMEMMSLPPEVAPDLKISPMAMP